MKASIKPLKASEQRTPLEPKQLSITLEREFWAAMALFDIAKAEAARERLDLEPILITMRFALSGPGEEWNLGVRKNNFIKAMKQRGIELEVS